MAAPSSASPPNPPAGSAAYRLIATPAGEGVLAYANTRYWRGSIEQTETLNSWGELLDWCAQNLGYRESEVRALADWAAAQPAAAAHLYDLAIAMREVLYRMFAALAGGQAVADLDLAALNQALAEAPPRAELARTTEGFAWRAPASNPAMPALLAPVLWSAADLAARARQARIRLCANPKCLYLFVDGSKGGTRRWCDMNACGNRAKAQRHYHKSKQA